MRAVAFAGAGSVVTAAAAMGGPALAGLAAVLALTLVALCWVIASPARTANLVNLVKAFRLTAPTRQPGSRARPAAPRSVRASGARSDRSAGP